MIAASQGGLTETERWAVRLALGGGGGITSSPVDRKRTAMVLKVYGSDALPIVMEMRENHRTWITLTQRRWQRETHRASRARHHDSLSIRERYVRCTS